MTPQMRLFYKLEKRWKDAEQIDISTMITLDKRNSESEMAEDDSEQINNDQNID